MNLPCGTAFLLLLFSLVPSHGRARILGLAPCESHTHPEALLMGATIWQAALRASLGESVPVMPEDVEEPGEPLLRNVLDLDTADAHYQIVPFEGLNYLSVRSNFGTYPKRLFEVPAEKILENHPGGKRALYPSDLSLLSANADGSLIAIGHRYSNLDEGLSLIEVLIYRARDLVPLRRSTGRSIKHELPGAWAAFSYADAVEAPRIERVIFSQDGSEIRVFVNLEENGKSTLHFGRAEIPTLRQP